VGTGVAAASNASYAESREALRSGSDRKAHASATRRAASAKAGEHGSRGWGRLRRLEEGGVAGGWDGGDEAKDGVGFGGPRREAPALGGAEGGGSDQEDVGARGAWVDGKDLDE